MEDSGQGGGGVAQAKKWGWNAKCAMNFPLVTTYIQDDSSQKNSQAPVNLILCAKFNVFQAKLTSFQSK